MNDVVASHGYGAGSEPMHYKKAKLTPAQRDRIRDRYAEGETASALAVEYGVARGTIVQYVDRRK